MASFNYGSFNTGATPPPPTPPNADATFSAPTEAKAFTPIYAGFWIRVLASLIDSFALGIPLGIISAVMQGIIAPLTKSAAAGGDPTAVFGMIGILAIASMILNWGGYCLYEGLLTAGPWQGTLGKKLLGLKVCTLEGKPLDKKSALWRAFMKQLLSAVTLSISCIFPAFTPKKQALHDTVVKTLVVKAK